MMRKHIVPILCLIACFIFLICTVGFSIKQDKWENSLAALIDESNSNQTEDDYVTENIQLKQDLAIAQKQVEEWKSYADNLSASIIFVPEYHEETTIKEVEVDKPVYVNNNWREFDSSAVLMAWAEEHLTTLWIVGNQAADCDDYASRLQLEAFKDGYILSVQLVENGRLSGKNVSNFLELHMGNLAMIGNTIYFIEPQPKYFRVVYVCDRD